MGGRRIGALVVAFALVVGIVVSDQSISSAQGAGSNLVHEVTATDPSEGGQIRLQDISAFSPSGGEAIFEPATAAEERFTYSGTDGNDQLLGITRTNPTSHPNGSFVEAVPQTEPTPTPSGDSTPDEPTASPTATEPSPADSSSTTESTSSSDPSADTSSPSTGSTEGTGSVNTAAGAGLCLDKLAFCVEDVLPLVCSLLTDGACEPPVVVVPCNPDPKSTDACTKIIDDACDTNNTGQSCQQAVAAEVAALEQRLDDIRGEMCGYDSWTVCIEKRGNETVTDVMMIVWQLEQRLDDIREENCGYDSWTTCIDKRGDEIVAQALAVVADAQARLDRLRQQYCGYDDWATCLYKAAMATIDSVCNDSEYATQGAEECVRMGTETIQKAIDIACRPYGTTDPATCAVAIVESIADAACNDSAYGTQGTSECINMIYAALETAVRILCPQSGQSPECLGELSTKLLTTIYDLMRTACQSSDAGTCANNLLTKLDTTLNNACYLLPVIPDGNTTGIPPGTATCVGKVLGTLSLIMNTACQSSSPSTCTANLVSKLDTTLNNTCYLVPVDPAGSTTGVPPGVATCVSKVLGTVNLVMTTACQSPEAATCVENLLTKINSTLITVCGLVPVTPSGTTGGLPPGVAACVTKVLGTVDLAMNTICQSTNAMTCVTNLVNKIDSTLATACGLVPVVPAGATTGVPTGVATCVAKVLGTINLVMTTACQSTDREACVSNLITKIDTALGTACGSVPVTGTGSTTGLPSGVSLCVLKILGTVDLAMRTACKSGDPNICFTNLVNGIKAAIDDVCNDSVTTTTGPDECANMVIEEVTRLLESCDQMLCEDPVGAVEQLCDPNNTGQTCVEFIIDELSNGDPCQLLAVSCEELLPPITCNPDPFGTNPCVPPPSPIPCNPLPDKPGSCDDVVANLIDQVCNSSDPATSGSGCANMLLPLVNSLLLSVCAEPASSTVPLVADACIDLVTKLKSFLDSLGDQVCQEDAVACAADDVTAYVVESLREICECYIPLPATTSNVDFSDEPFDPNLVSDVGEITPNDDDYYITDAQEADPDDAYGLVPPGQCSYNDLLARPNPVPTRPSVAYVYAVPSDASAQAHIDRPKDCVAFDGGEAHYRTVKSALSRAAGNLAVWHRTEGAGLEYRTIRHQYSNPYSGETYKARASYRFRSERDQSYWNALKIINARGGSPRLEALRTEMEDRGWNRSATKYIAMLVSTAQLCTSTTPCGNRTSGEIIGIAGGTPGTYGFTVRRMNSGSTIRYGCASKGDSFSGHELTHLLGANHVTDDADEPDLMSPSINNGLGGATRERWDIGRDDYHLDIMLSDWVIDSPVEDTTLRRCR